MSYRSDTISTMVRVRLNRNHFLPAIQREFVWSPRQVSTLFDSLMREYPIGSFLFWELEPENRDKWEIYKFLENVERQEKHNKIANTAGEQQITLVLDGQQRLTALNIGLKGFYETKRKWMRWNNPMAWVQRRLYLDLLRDPQPTEGDSDEGMRYGFQFLADGSDGSDGEHFWFRVGRILDVHNDDKLQDLIDQEQESLPDGVTKEQHKVLRRNLTKLHRVVWRDQVIWHHTEHVQDFDRVLDIFIRANSGGTTLSKSDLLLSTITARWKSVNARKEIYDFVDRINRDLTRSSNNFSKDFVMKSCLVLCDLPVQYRVQNFNNQNLESIFERWERIKAAVEAGVSLANHFGMDRDTLLSQNALIPVIYYLYFLNGATLRGSSYFEAENAAAIRKWLTAAMLNNVFGYGSDTMLRETRRIIRESFNNGEKNFPVEALNRRIAELGRSTDFSDAVVDEVLHLTYGTSRAFLALTLLYDRRDFGIVAFHQDHIFPRALFADERLEAAGIPQNKWSYYRELCNQLGNLELLLSHENEEKNAKDFGEWVKTRDTRFKQEHLIPEDEDLLTLERFEELVAAREELIRERLRKLFWIESTQEINVSNRAKTRT